MATNWTFATSLKIEQTEPNFVQVGENQLAYV
mgnify:CR=1 FL=1